MSSKVDVLLVISPGPLRDGLRALLVTTRLVRSIVLADEIFTVLPGIRENPPGLVILDDRLVADSLPLLVEGMKAAAPETGILVIVDSVDRLREVKASVPVPAVLQGAAAADLAALVDALLS